jgi:hypothetical protein
LYPPFANQLPKLLIIKGGNVGAPAGRNDPGLIEQHHFFFHQAAITPCARQASENIFINSCQQSLARGEYREYFSTKTNQRCRFMIVI